jgi:hypothetical protein
MAARTTFDDGARPWARVHVALDQRLGDAKPQRGGGGALDAWAKAARDALSADAQRPR